MLLSVIVLFVLYISIAKKWCVPSHNYMKYVNKQSEQRKIRKCNVTWFNPPFNQNVTTNVARQCLSLVDKHFPKHHRCHKLFDRNNVKCSYSCMNNMASIISSHNAKVLAPAPEQASRTCNCRQPQNCPLNGHCLTECRIQGPGICSQ